MKALLFMKYCPGVTLEKTIYKYDGKRNGRLDYFDNVCSIEIDDGPNIKSIRKMLFVRNEMNKEIYWILLLTSGHGGRSIHQSNKYDIPLLRIYLRNNQSGWYEWS